MKALKTVLISALTALAPVTAALPAEDVVVVYDASGSMWGQIDGVSKIEIAREVMADLVGNWSDATHLGLVAYDHRSEGNCGDIETLIAPGPVDRASFIETVNSIRPKGKTPISAAVRHAAETLSFRDNPATVILISDGVETCNADPCALAGELAQQGVKFTAHVIGFDLEDEAHASLACIAENTGGVFVPARDAAGLRDALAQVQEVVEQPAEPVEPAPEIEAEIGVSAPEQVTTGARFKVSWSASIHPQDYVTIVPAGAEEGSYGHYVRVRDRTEDQLVAPAEPGLYEVRYLLQEGGRTMASTPVEVVEAEVAVSGPDVARAGTSLRVTWSPSIHPEDFITIVPAGSEEGAYAQYIRVRDKQQGDLAAPDEPGFYEIRYVLREGSRTLARHDVEIVAADAPLDEGAGLSLPQRAGKGETITVSWSGDAGSADQRIALARADQADFTWIAAQRIGAGNSLELKMPDEAGSYEVRFLDISNRKVLGRALVQVD